MLITPATIDGSVSLTVGLSAAVELVDIPIAPASLDHFSGISWRWRHPRNSRG